jgi:hypothetical protein
MRKPTVIIGCLMLALLVAHTAWAQVRVRATVDRTRVAVGESLNLRVVVEGEEGQIDVSAITDFKVISEGTTTSVQIINSRTTRQTIHNYLLMPNRQGDLIIPALSVKANRGIYRTQPIRITAVAAGQAPQDDQARDVWVTAAVSNAAPVVGQQIIYTFRLHTTTQLANANFQPPAFDGFNAKELEDQRTSRQVINGREAIITELRFVLIPLAAGDLTIEPAALRAGIVKSSGPRGRTNDIDDFFNRSFFRRRQVVTRVLQTEALDVLVQPLPPLPEGMVFSGLVGRFQLTAALDKAELAVGDSTTLSVTVAGQGNIMDAQAPELALPPELKAYSDSPEEQIGLQAQGYSGQKTFRTALVPVQAGTYNLAPIRLAYFDTDKQAYQVLTAATGALQVSAASVEAAPLTIGTAPLQKPKKQVTFTGRDILPPKESLDAVASSGALSIWLFVLALGLPATVAGTVYGVQKLRRQDLSPRARMKVKALEALNKAKGAEADPAVLLSSLYQSLTAAIMAAIGRQGEALTWEEAEALLRQNGLDEERARQAAQLLVEIESAKFSGSTLSADQRQALLTQTRQMVRKLLP